MRRLIVLLTLLCLTASGVPAFGGSAPGTYYQLDTGVVFLWQEPNGTWQYGLMPGTDMSSGFSLNIAGSNDPATIKNATVTPYRNDFSFAENRNFSWNPNQYAVDQDSYNIEYYDKSIQITGVSPFYDSQTGMLTVTWNGTIPSDTSLTFDVKNLLDQGLASEVYARMGVTRETANADIRQRIDEYDPVAGASSAVRSYMFFAPTIIQYDVVPAGLLPPKVLIDCKATSMFIGLTTPVKGAVQNRNTVPVITRYRLTANDALLKSGTALQEAGKSLKVEGTYTIPAATKPGKLFTFRLWAEQTAAYTAPDRHLPREEGEPPVENPAYAAFAAAHTYVPQAGAWYKNDAPWLPGQAECRKTAVLQPEAPLDHRLNPAVIVE